MAGGIDWFRWFHGSATDPKFGLVARKAGARLGDVVTMWAFLLEAASAAHERGNPGKPDFAAIDYLLDMQDGCAADIYEQLVQRGLVDGETGRIAAWEKRQPKREREDDNSTERSRLHRQRQAEQCNAAQRHATPDQATQRQETPRGEESRGDTYPTSDEVGVREAPASTAIVAPGSDDEGMPACPHQAIIESFHRLLPTARRVRDWTPARQALLRARWREDRKRQSVEWWERFFAYCAKSRFLTGQVSQQGRKPFELGLEWLVKAENFAKAREGAFHDDEVAA